MKKLGLIAATTGLIALVLFIGAKIWFDGHKEEIARSLTGKDIRFADLSLHYSPMPSIVLTDLTWTEGNYACTIPKLRLYPDLSEIFKGRIHLKKTILEKPIFVAEGVDGRPSDDPGNPPFPGSSYSLETFPDGVVSVNEGKIILQQTQGTILPVYVTAQAEKTNHHFSIHLNQTSIEELGLQFAGTVSVTSINPLTLHVEATRGTFNPGAVKDFLFKFGFLEEPKTTWIPPITHIETQSLILDYTAGSEGFHLKSPSLTMDQTEFKDIDLSLTQGGSFAVQWTNASIDAKSAYSWLQHSPEGKRWVDDFLSQIQVNEISPEGIVHISSLDIVGKRQEETGIDVQTLKGEMGIELKNLRLGLVAENGQKGQLTIDAFEAKIVFDQGQTAVKIEKMTFHSPEGGKGQVTGRIPLPLNFQKTILSTAIDELRIFDTTIDFHLEKGKQPKSAFDLAIASPFFELSGDGLFYLPGRNQADIEIRIGRLHIAESTPKEKTQSEAPERITDQPFATHWIPETDFSATVSANKFQWGKSNPLRNINIRFEAKNNAAVLTGKGRLCGVNCTTSAYLMPPSRLVTTLETKGTDVNLTSLVACFSKELPVYLEGRLYVTGGFSSYGDNPREWIDGAEGDMMITVNRAVVHRISALDPRLGFLLDILNTAGIHSGHQDAIQVRKGTVRANLSKGRFIVDRFSLAGPMLNAWGKGTFIIENKHLRLTGGVTTQLGVTKGLDVDRYLIKKGETG